MNQNVKGVNHPANGQLSGERIVRVQELLKKAAAQSDGGNLGYAMADAAKGLGELLQRRSEGAAEGVVIHCYHYNAEMKTCHRAGYIGTRERVADRESYYRLMELIGEVNNDTVTGIVSLGYLGETIELLQGDCQQIAVNGSTE
ncbi:TPA: hypothetical protein PFE29_000106 [Kluyvera ascorbata]|nr:hypothetical protein [Kluyvera ascorbata]